MLKRPAHETLSSVPPPVSRQDAALVLDASPVGAENGSPLSDPRKKKSSDDSYQHLMLVKPKPSGCRLFPVSKAKQLTRNRKLLNKYLKRLSGNQSISLDENGCCYLPVKKFLITVEVPDNGTGLCYFNTKVYDLSSIASGQTKSRKKIAAVRMNETKSKIANPPPGAIIDMDGNEINLYFSVPADGLKCKQFFTFMESFLQRATEVNSNLRAVA